MSLIFQTTKKYLIVLRVGQTSLHNQWEIPQRENRSYDIVASYFQKSLSNEFLQVFDASHYCEGLKWNGLYQTLSQLDLEQYEYIWLPDDDLLIDHERIEELFAFSHEHKALGVQPSLTHDSYLNLGRTVQIESLKYRAVSWVEIMAPCWHKSVIDFALPYFNEVLSGTGLEHVICQHYNWPKDMFYILDNVSMTHTRPSGGPHHEAVRKKGTDPKDEGIKMLKAHNIPQRRFKLNHFWGVDQQQDSLISGYRLRRKYTLAKKSAKNTQKFT